MLDKLPYNILLYCILPYLRDEEMRTLSALCKRTNRIVHQYCLADKTFIKNLCQIGDLLIIYKRELIVDNPFTFKLICERGYVNLVKRSFSPRYFLLLRDRGLHGACRGGHRKIIDLMIERGANNWHWGLREACQGGHREIINLMIEKGACSWEWGLQGACLGGHREIVDLMIKKGANNWNWGLGNACYGGYREIIDLMIEKGANNWNLGLQGACYQNHCDIIDLMIEKGADDWNRGLTAACQGGHRKIVNLMIERGATNCSWCSKELEKHL